MAITKLTDAEFMSEFGRLGASGLSKKHNIDLRWIMRRRRSIETRHGAILSPGAPPVIKYPQRATLDIENGHVLVGSDLHAWPGQRSTAFRAFVKFCKDVKPRAVIMNGDVVDLPQISRHASIGWENHPTVADEVEHAQTLLSEIELAAFKAEKIWTLGNHDMRFETRLATQTPEYKKLQGVHLKDHFPNWRAAWSCWINDDVVVKHRIKGGIHATHNNVVTAGKHTVTGHLHSAKVTPWTNYNGDFYGVDTGCMADIYAPQFTDYLEDGPRNWRSGFALLTFHKGKLLLPELVLVYDERHIQWRGEVIKV